jgi:hypothetical protein
MLKGFSERIENMDPSLMAKIFVQAESVLKSKRIDPDDFTMYDPDIVEADKRYVKIRKEGFGQDKDKIKDFATIFEALLVDQIEASSWFGENVRTMVASDFDDIANGVDAWAEFITKSKQSDVLALAVDVTFKNDLSAKFERIKGEIQKGELTKIRYFKSGDGGFVGEKRKVPRVVVGADVLAIEKVAQLWHQNETGFLAKHPMQLQVLEEVLVQCEAFRKFAMKNNQPEIAEEYQKHISRLASVYHKKKASGAVLSSDYQTHDRVYAGIMDQSKKMLGK